MKTTPDSETMRSLREIRERLEDVLHPSVRQQFDSTIDRLETEVCRGPLHAASKRDLMELFVKVVFATTSIMNLVDRFRD